jgi:hypothetical protein
MKYILTILISLLFFGCSLKDPESCEMKKSRIILNLNLDSGTPESQELFTKIQNININFDISNRTTNIINTNYFEAEAFYKEYQNIIDFETKKIRTGKSDFARELSNKASVNKNECPIKTVYINGIHTEILTNVEYIITLSD